MTDLDKCRENSAELRRRLRGMKQDLEDAPIVFAVKGLGGLSRTLVSSTRKEAEMMRLSAISQHPTTEEQERAAATLSVVPVRLVEVRDE